MCVNRELRKPIQVGNVVLVSKDPIVQPTRIAAYEMYVGSKSPDEFLQISGIAQGGENMVFGPGTLSLVGTGNATASAIACTTCNVAGGGRMLLTGVTIGHLGGMLLAQVLVTGHGSRFEARDVTLNDLSVIAESGGVAEAHNCIELGKLTSHPKTGGQVMIRCDGLDSASVDHN
jgi:hypothetical protein